MILYKSGGRKMKCIYCNSENLHKRGSYKGKQTYQCKNCGKYFTKGEAKNKYEYIIHFNSKLRKIMKCLKKKLKIFK